MSEESSPYLAMISCLQAALEQSLDRYRDEFPDISVETGDLEDHAGFIPLIAELLSREDSRGTKGMSGGQSTPDAIHDQIADALQAGTAIIVRAGDELIGYATLATWEVDEGNVLEFCSAVVDDAFRGRGFGRLLVDARELVALEEYIPEGYQPIAFCNESSARIYNRDIWLEMPWEWYRRYPVPVVCREECQTDRSACDCTVLAMSLEQLAGFTVP